MSSLSDAEQAYSLAVLYHERGNLKLMVKWMTVYEDLCRDARTTLKASEAQSVRLVSWPVSARVTRCAVDQRADGARKVNNGHAITRGNRLESRGK